MKMTGTELPVALRRCLNSMRDPSPRLMEIAVVCESLRRRKQQACVAGLAQQSRYAPQHRRVVIDDINKVRIWRSHQPADPRRDQIGPLDQKPRVRKKVQKWLLNVLDLHQFRTDQSAAPLRPSAGCRLRRPRHQPSAIGRQGPSEGAPKRGDRATSPIEDIHCEQIRGCSYSEAARPA